MPDDFPPGDYTLIAALYNPSLPGAPRILTTEGADVVMLARFVVDRLKTVQTSPKMSY